jgi:hypothetical protein
MENIEERVMANHFDEATELLTSIERKRIAELAEGLRDQGYFVAKRAPAKLIYSAHLAIQVNGPIYLPRCAELRPKDYTVTKNGARFTPQDKEKKTSTKKFAKWNRAVVAIVTEEVVASIKNMPLWCEGADVEVSYYLCLLDSLAHEVYEVLKSCPIARGNVLVNSAKSREARGFMRSVIQHHLYIARCVLNTVVHERVRITLEVLVETLTDEILIDTQRLKASEIGKKPEVVNFSSEISNAVYAHSQKMFVKTSEQRFRDFLNAGASRLYALKGGVPVEKQGYLEQPFCDPDPASNMLDQFVQKYQNIFTPAQMQPSKLDVAIMAPWSNASIKGVFKKYSDSFDDIRKLGAKIVTEKRALTIDETNEFIERGWTYNEMCRSLDPPAGIPELPVFPEVCIVQYIDEVVLDRGKASAYIQELMQLKKMRAEGAEYQEGETISMKLKNSIITADEKNDINADISSTLQATCQKVSGKINDALFFLGEKQKNTIIPTKEDLIRLLASQVTTEIKSRFAADSFYKKKAARVGELVTLASAGSRKAFEQLLGGSENLQVEYIKPIAEVLHSAAMQKLDLAPTLSASIQKARVAVNELSTAISSDPDRQNSAEYSKLVALLLSSFGGKDIAVQKRRHFGEIMDEEIILENSEIDSDHKSASGRAIVSKEDIEMMRAKLKAGSMTDIIDTLKRLDHSVIAAGGQPLMQDVARSVQSCLERAAIATGVVFQPITVALITIAESTFFLTAIWLSTFIWRPSNVTSANAAYIYQQNKEALKELARHATLISDLTKKEITSAEIMSIAKGFSDAMSQYRDCTGDQLHSVEKVLVDGVITITTVLAKYGVHQNLKASAAQVRVLAQMLGGDSKLVGPLEKLIISKVTSSGLAKWLGLMTNRASVDSWKNCPEIQACYASDLDNFKFGELTINITRTVGTATQTERVTLHSATRTPATFEAAREVIKEVYLICQQCSNFLLKHWTADGQA